ncbi:MAG: DUF503 domain-containing protein [Acidimicrobiales bacterium]|jgi:uncharacterized protein YlxP (DUF503 family)
MIHACALDIELRIPESHSLKEKRTTVRHLVEACRSRFGVAAAEVGYQDQWQRCELGFATVSGSPGQVEAILDSVEQFVWSHPEIEVLDVSRAWLETDR